MKRILALSLLALIASPAALALEGPKMAFDATYESSGPAGTSTLRMMSDGKGHMRTDTNAANQQVINIVDYPALQSTTLLVSQHMAIKGKINEAKEGIHDAESAKRLHAKDLGTKVVDGHPCHGYQYSSDAGDQTVWIGDDTHYLVHSEMTTKKGMKMSTTLKAWSSQAPSADKFQVPAGYREMQIPSMAAAGARR